jgi:hypothetical protein
LTIVRVSALRKRPTPTPRPPATPAARPHAAPIDPLLEPVGAGQAR